MSKIPLKQLVRQQLAANAKKQAVKQVNTKNLKRVAFQITTNSGASYKELARRMALQEIPSYTILSDWLWDLFDKSGLLKQNLVQYKKTSSLIPKQVRDEDLDTAYAKGLGFTLEDPKGEGNEEPLNTPGLFFKEQNQLWLPVGIHRHWYSLEILKADLFPVIEIPETIMKSVPMGTILNMSRFDNSVIKQNKNSTIKQDAYSVKDTFKHWLIETNKEYRSLSPQEQESYFLELLSNRYRLQTKYPEYWHRLYKIGQEMSSVHKPVTIRNHLLKERGGYNSFRNGKIDVVKTSARKNWTELEQTNMFVDNLGKKFEITLCEGGNQQEQTVLARIPRKRLTEGHPIKGVICGTGSSPTSILHSRINSLQLFLPLGVQGGFYLMRDLLLVNYGDGFFKFPQFHEGLSNENVEIGNKKFLFSCDPEDETSVWEEVSVSQVLDFLQQHLNKYPKSHEFIGDDWVVNSLQTLVFPKNSTIEEIPKRQ